MLKLTIQKTPKTVIASKIFTVECPECQYENQFVVIGPMCCAGCLTMLPEAMNVILMAEDRYDYFVGNIGIIWY